MNAFRKSSANPPRRSYKNWLAVSAVAVSLTCGTAAHATPAAPHTPNQVAKTSGAKNRGSRSGGGDSTLAGDDAGVESTSGQPNDGTSIDFQDGPDAEVEAQKADVSQKLDALEHLGAKQRQDFKDQVSQAATREQVDQLIAQAQQADAIKAVAEQTIDGLSRLDTGQKQGFDARVEQAPTVAQVQPVVDEAQQADDQAGHKQDQNQKDQSNGRPEVQQATQDATNLAGAKVQAHATIDSLTAISAGQKQGFDARVEQAPTVAQVQPVVDEAQQADDQAGHKQDQNQKDQSNGRPEVQQATQDATNLAGAKVQAHATIDSLTAISAGQKQGFDARVEQAPTVAQVQPVVDEAQQADDQAGHKQDQGQGQTQQPKFDSEKSASKQVGDELPYDPNPRQGDFGIQVSKYWMEHSHFISADKMSEFKKTLGDAQWDSQFRGDLDAFIASIKKAEWNGFFEAAKDLVGYDEANHEWEDVHSRHLHDEEEVSYKQADDLYNTYLTYAVPKGLESRELAARDAINKLPNLSSEQKKQFRDQVFIEGKYDRRWTPEQVAEQIKRVNGVVSAAAKADQDIATRVKPAKADAHAKINALPNLSQDQKDSFNTQVDQASQINKINDLVNAAKQADQGALDSAKSTAHDTINKLPNLSNSGKFTYNLQVDQATTITAVTQVINKAQAADAKELTDARSAAHSTINQLGHLTKEHKDAFGRQIDGANTIDAIQAAITAARQADGADQSAQVLAAAKAQAHATVNALGHLTPEHKAAANTAVDAAKTTVEVHTAVDTAQKQDETDRQAAIDAAINKDGVDKTHLTPGQRQHLKDHGKDAQSPDQIKKLADELKALGEAQRQAHATVNALGHLTPEHKKAFNDQVDAADTVEKVHQAETAAKNADGADQSAQVLAAAKAQAHATVNALGHLTPEHKAAANTAVDAAKTTVEVHTAVDTAQKQDETDRQAAIDAAINKDGVDKTHLTPGQRQHLKDHGKDAQSPDQIKKLADELKALGEAQRQAHATVNALGHLTPEHKKAFNDQVDAADTVEKVHQAETAAKNADGADQSAQVLAAAKAQAHATVNALGHLTPEHKAAANTAVDAAKTTVEVHTAVDTAQKQDETDRQAAIDAAINKDGVDKTHLTPGQRQHLKDHGKDAQSPDQIKKLADELKALGEAQRQAHATVNALGHLTPEHKAAANTQVDAADTVEKVQVAVQHAQSQDETDRQAAIDAAINKDGVDKTHLTPGQRQHLKDHGKDAQSPDQIKKLADELKALGEAQRQAHATVNALGHLTPEHKAAANTQVDAADTVEKVQVAVQHAQSQDETDRQAAIDAAINKDGVDKTHLTPGQRQHLKDHGKDAQSPDQIKKLADELKALGEAQRQAHATVNALGHLTPEHKAAANTQVDAADTVEKVQVAVQHAQSQDETDRQAAIDAAINKDGVDKTHLTPGQRQHLKDHGKDAQSPDQIKKLADELKALGEAQRQAHATVNALGHLTPEHKAAANTQVDAADTVEKVQVAVQHAQSQDETDRQAAIDAAINKDGVDKTHLTPGQRQHLKDHGKDAQSPDQIKKLADELKALGEAQRQAHATVNALGHLTPEHKAAANTQVDAADTVEKVQVAVQHAQSQDETDRQAAIDAAINKDGVDKTHLTPGQRQHLKDHGKDAQSPDQIKKLADELKALGEAQRQAHATVNALGHLTPEHKAAANTQVDAADTVEKVQVAVQHAQSQDETDRQAAIDAAINKDGVDKTHLTPGQRQHLKDHGKDAQSPDQIKKLADELKALGEAQRQAHATVNALGHLTPEHKKAFNDQVDAADTVEKVHQAETAAKNADGADQSAQVLAAAKAQAHATVNALGHLTPEHKAAANTAVDAAKTTVEVHTAVDTAQKQDETDRQAAIDAAINKDGVDKTHLTPGQRQHLKDHGKDAQSPDQIKKLADELKALGEAQRQAHATVNALGHLTPEHKKAFNDQVDAADTVEKVHQAETAAKNADGADQSAQVLAAAKAQAHATVNALGHLTPEHKAAANTAVDAAKTTVEVHTAVDTAQKQDETDRQAAIDAAINKDGVDKTHLTPGQRQHLKDHGKDAQSPDQIKKLADELKALGEAQRQAHATVNALGHLTPEHKKAFNDQVDAADTVEKVHQAETAAKNADGADQSAQVLAAAKAQAHATVNALGHLTPEHKAAANTAVDAAKTTVEVHTAVDTAQKQDETDRQAAIDAAINKDGVDKTHLTPGQRQHLKDHGKDAQSPEQIKKLADELKALGEAQRQAHATVNALGHLTPEHKKAFNDQVDAADTVEKVQVAVQHAQSQDETDRQAAIDAAINKDGVDKTHLTPGQRQHLKDHGKDAQSPDQIKKLADELKALGEAQRQAHATVNALGHLTPEHKAAANTQVDAADTVEKVQVAVQHAQSQDETDRQAAIDAAINKDGVDKTHLTPGQRQHLKDHGKDAQSPDQIKKLADELKALGEAQRQAHATVNALGHLTPEHKAAANTQVDAADTVEKVQVAVQHAQSQDETDRQAAIDAAINKDGVDKTHLTPGQRQHLKDHGKDAQSPDQIKKLADELKALGEAQRQAHATVNALGHLTPEHKAAANTQVDAADTVEKVQVAVQHAQSQDETDRQAAIDAAINKDGVDKTHLTPGQRQHLKDHGKDAQSPDQIKKLADELKALGEAQRQAHATVNALGHLTPEHKKAFNDQVDAADTVEKVHQAETAAKNADGADQSAQVLAAAKAQAHATVNALGHLTPEHKAAANTAVDAAKTTVEVHTAVDTAQKQDETDRQAAIDAAINKDGVDKTHLTPGQRQHLKDHGKDAQSPDQIKKLADELKALGEAQRQAHATVNALGHLTPEHKKAFNDQVDAADTVEKVHQAETAAKNADGADQSAQVLAAAKAQAHATVNALGHLTPEHKAAANTAVDAAKTTVEVHTAVDTAQKQDETDRQAAIDAAINKDGVDKTHLTPGQRQHLKDHGKDAQSPDQIKKLADELKALGEAQRQAHATVNALGHLTPEHKKAFNDQVDAADTVEKVHQAETAAKNADGADQSAQVLAAAKAQAHATVNALGHLTPEHKAAANTAVDAAKTTVEVHTAVDTAQKQDETDRQAAIDAAINKDGVDKTHLTPGQRQHLKDHGKDAQSPEQIKKLADELKALGEAQRQAHATVNALGHLTPEHKKAFNDQVDAADTVEKVQVAVQHAQSQDETDRQAAIDAAINKDGVDKTHLTPGQRQHLKDHGKDAQSPDQIKKLADELKALGEAQRQAHATVNALGHLTPEHKKAFNDQVDAADTVEKVQVAVQHAQSQDETDRQAAIDAAINKDGVDKTHLTPGQRQHLKDHGKDAQSPDQIKKLADELKALGEAQRQAHATVNALGHLTPEHKKAFNDQVDAADTVEKVQVAVQHAQSQDETDRQAAIDAAINKDGVDKTHLTPGQRQHLKDHGKDAQSPDQIKKLADELKALGEAQRQAHATVNALGHLTPEHKKAFNDQVDAADTVEKVQVAVQHAQSQDETDRQAAIDAAINKDGVDKTHLTPGQRQHLKDHGKDAQSPDQIKKLADELKALGEAQRQAHATVNALGHLTPEHKKAFNDQVDAADTVEKVHQAETAAKNADGADQSAQVLAAAKAQAHATVNALGHLTPEHKAAANTAVDAAKTTVEVHTAVDTAQKQDETDRQAAIDAAINKDGVDKTHLTPGQRQHLKDHGKDAQSPDQIKKLADELKALGEAQAQAHATVNALGHLTPEHKKAFNDQVDAADTVEKVHQAETAAKNADGADQSAQVLAAAKAQAHATVNALGHLTPEHKAAANTAVDAAKTTVEVHTAVDTAQKQDETDRQAAIDAAINKDGVDKTHLTPGQRQHLKDHGKDAQSPEQIKKLADELKALGEAQRQAHATVNALGHLTPEHKAAANTQVDAADTVEKVQVAVQHAQSQDETDRQAAIDAAINKDGVDKTHLTPGQRQHLKDHGKDAQSPDQIKKLADELKALGEAQRQAHATVNALGHLTPEHKAAANTQVDAADTVEKVHQAETAAKNADGADHKAAVGNIAQGSGQAGGPDTSAQAGARHAGQGGRHLAQTGRELADLAGVSAALLVAGVAVVAIVRRRKKHL